MHRSVRAVMLVVMMVMAMVMMMMMEVMAMATMVMEMVMMMAIMVMEMMAMAMVLGCGDDVPPESPGCFGDRIGRIRLFDERTQCLRLRAAGVGSDDGGSLWMRGTAPSTQYYCHNFGCWSALVRLGGMAKTVKTKKK
jgi:hypothetical protein